MFVLDEQQFTQAGEVWGGKIVHSIDKSTPQLIPQLTRFSLELNMEIKLMMHELLLKFPSGGAG